MDLVWRVCSHSSLKRFWRQIDVSLIRKAQLKLKTAKVIVVGAGGLGCPVLQHLGAAGVGACLSCPARMTLTRYTGRIGIIDHDRVELSNLQRQILHTESRVGWYKAESAAHALREYGLRKTPSVYMS